MNKSIKAIGITILAVIVGHLVFRLIVDPLVVPIVGMRPVLAAITMILFVVPAAKISMEILGKQKKNKNKKIK